MLFAILKKIKFKGKIVIVDANGKTYNFGSSPPHYPYCKARFKNKSIQRRVLRNPSLYIGEGYMNNEIVIEEGTIEDFLSIITASYSDFFFKKSFF